MFLNVSFIVAILAVILAGLLFIRARFIEWEDRVFKKLRQKSDWEER